MLLFWVLLKKNKEEGTIEQWELGNWGREKTTNTQAD